jgi:hypothetical protein
MAKITTAGGDSCPYLQISINITGGVVTFDATKDIVVPFLQNITINNSTNIYSYNIFCADEQKITTTASNSIETTAVLDDVVWFGDAAVPVALDAQSYGILKLASNKQLVAFKLWLNDADGTAAAGSGKTNVTGYGYISGVAPTASAQAPIWISPLTIAVDGNLTYTKL